MLGLSRQQRLQAVGVLSPKPLLKRLSVRLQRVSAEQLCVRSHGAPGDEDRRCDPSAGTDVRCEMDSVNAEDVSATDGVVDEDRSSKLGVVGAPALDGIGDGNSSIEVEGEACRGDEDSDCGVGTNTELDHRVDSMHGEDIGAAADGGDGDRSKETGVEEAPATAADGEDAVVRPTSKVSRKRKADQQIAGPDTGVGDDCLESEKQSCLADKCTKSLCSIVGLSKFSSLPSADVDVSEAVLIPVPSRSDLQMTLGHCPASVDQASVTTLASSGLNNTSQEDDAMELPGDEVEQTEGEARHGAVSDEDRGRGVGTDPKSHHQVNSMNAEDIGAAADGGDGDRSKETGVEAAPATAAGGEDAVVRPRSKVSRKRKADQQSAGPETTELKQSCLADKRTASLSSSSSSSKSTILLSPDVAIPETVLTPVLSGSDLEQTAGHRRAAVHWNSLATSDLKKNLEEDDAVKLSGKESEQREGEEARTAVTAGSRIAAPSTPTVASCTQFRDSLRLTSHPAVRQDGGVVDDDGAADDGDGGPDGVWNHRGGDVGGRRRRFAGRGASRCRGGPSSTGPTLDPGDDAAGRERGCGRVRGRRFGRRRGGGGGRGRRSGRSSTDPTHHDPTGGDGGVNEIASSEYSSFLRQLTAMPVFGVDPSSTRQDAPTAGYTGKQNVGFDLK